jgi:hypothetical protein
MLTPMMTPTVYRPSSWQPPSSPTARKVWVLALALLVVLLLLGCAQAYLTPALHQPNEPILQASPSDMLKVHMRSGELYVLNRWELADSARRLRGSGTRYDALRSAARADSVDLDVLTIALLETNSQSLSYAFGLQGIGAMNILGGFIALTCLADPKSCFGSCPTFYVEGEDSTRVHAEGFSSSVARVLEARDVDALANARITGRRVAIHMRNEAYETHMVRSVALLAVPRPPGGRVLAASDSAFYPATRITAPGTCRSPEGDCLETLASHDSRERLSPTDSNDLAAREEIYLTFPNPTARAGLVLTARNSLVTTFLFYQTLSYFGTRAADAVASMERGTREQAESRFGMAQLLGGVDVQLRDVSGEWRTVGSYGEAGPIASDTKVVPLPGAATGAPLEVRLRMAKGSWRLDWVALAELGDAVVPTRVLPSRVDRHGRRDAAALAQLSAADRHLVAMPGDDFRLSFELPAPAESLELFLESQGYYYEWMRREWLAEENPLMAALVVHNPAEGLRQLARPYKSREAQMEALFWSSRFNTRGDDAPRH